MNRKNNKRKGFTIVELVIVIAVIGILAGIMIPTFGTVVANANESALDNKAAAIYKEYITNFDYTTGKTPIQDGFVVADGKCYTLEKGNVVVEGKQLEDDAIDKEDIIKGCYVKAEKDEVYKVLDDEHVAKADDDSTDDIDESAFCKNCDKCFNYADTNTDDKCDHCDAEAEGHAANSNP